MTSSQASKRRIFGGAVGTGPSRIASSAREHSKSWQQAGQKRRRSDRPRARNTVRPDKKEIGEVTQHGRPALVGAVRDRAVELLDEFEGSAHRSWETVLVGHGSGICGWLTSIQIVRAVGLGFVKADFGGRPFYCLRSPQYLCGRCPNSQTSCTPTGAARNWSGRSISTTGRGSSCRRRYKPSLRHYSASARKKPARSRAGCKQPKSQPAPRSCAGRTHRANRSAVSCRCPRDATRRPQLPRCRCLPQRLAIDTYSSIVMAGPFRPSMSLN